MAENFMVSLRWGFREEGEDMLVGRDGVGVDVLLIGVNV